METFYKIRRKNDGQFFQGPVWRHTFSRSGKPYKTLKAARDITATFQDHDNLEIVEYQIQEAAVHTA